MLGKGGFGEVYKAYDTELEKTVAIKILSYVNHASKSALKKEFEVLSKLAHPHLVKVYSFGFVSDDIPYFTMEYIEGINLKMFLSRPGSKKHVLHIIDQTLKALGYLHEQQIIHGDIKPENILLSTDNNSKVTLKILDFGLALTIQDTVIQTSGTPRFIAPEVLSQQVYSPASDLYSLGITLIESLTGKEIPYAHDIDTSFYKIAHSSLSSLLASQGIQNPSAIASFIFNLADQDPTTRPDNANNALQRFKVIVDISSYDITHIFDDIFINRKRELELVNRLINRNNIDTRVLILEGPMGIGKKALTNKAIAIAQPEGYFVLDLSDPSFMTNTIERFIDTISINLPRVKREAFLDSHNKILSLIQEATDSQKSISENVKVAYSNIIGYLRAIADNGQILICIPDIERFSEDFFQFLDQLIHELHLPDTNMRLIISHNTDKSLSNIKSEIFKRSSNLSYSSIIDLQPFKDKELKELQQILFGRILFNKHQTKQIIKDTEGIPLLILEYIKHLILHNAIQFDHSIWTLDQLLYAEMPIPKDITAYIEGEYSKYDRITIHLLQYIAFWDTDISRDTLTTLSGITASDLDSYLLPLIDSSIIEQEGFNTYRLTHDVYVKYIKKKTSKKKAQKINASILNHLEYIDPTDFERLAKHSINALSISKSMNYVFSAVDQLERKMEYHKCYDLLNNFKALLQINGNNERLITVLDRIAPIELLIGYYDDALRDYEQLFNYVTDDKKKAIYSKSIVNIYFLYFGDPHNAMKYINISMSYANKVNDPCINAELLLELSMIQKDNREALRKKALTLVNNVDLNLYAKISSFLMRSYIQAGKYDKAKLLQPELQSLLLKVSQKYKRYLYNGLYTSTFYIGEYSKAQHFTEECIKTNTELCDEIGLILNYNDLGGLYYIQGLFYDQIRILTIALKNIQKYNTYDCSFYYGNLSLAYRSVADYRKASKALDNATYYYNNLIGEYATEWTLSKYNYYYVLMGDKENTNYRKYLNKTIATATKTNNSIALGHTKLVNALYYYQRLLHSYSLRYLTAALTIFRKANDRDDVVDSLRLLSMIHIEKGNLDKARQTISEAYQIFNEIHCDYLKPQLLLAEGALARAQQSPDAESKLTEALKTSKKMFTREYTWQIQRELALYHKDRGELHKALQYYRDAIDMIKEITETIDGDELKASYLALPFRKRVFDEIKALKKQLK